MKMLILTDLVIGTLAFPSDGGFSLIIAFFNFLLLWTLYLFQGVSDYVKVSSEAKKERKKKKCADYSQNCFSSTFSFF